MAQPIAFGIPLNYGIESIRKEPFILKATHGGKVSDGGFSKNSDRAFELTNPPKEGGCPVDIR